MYYVYYPSSPQKIKDGWWDGSVGRCLPLELDPDMHLNSLALQYVFVTSVLCSAGTRQDPQSCWSVNSEGCSEEWERETLPRKIRWTVMGEDTQSWPPKIFTSSTWMHVICTYIFTDTCTEGRRKGGIMMCTLYVYVLTHQWRHFPLSFSVFAAALGPDSLLTVSLLFRHLSEGTLWRLAWRCLPSDKEGVICCQPPKELPP